MRSDVVSVEMVVGGGVVLVVSVVSCCCGVVVAFALSFGVGVWLVVWYVRLCSLVLRT